MKGIRVLRKRTKSAMPYRMVRIQKELRLQADRFYQQGIKQVGPSGGSERFLQFVNKLLAFTPSSVEINDDHEQLQCAEQSRGRNDDGIERLHCGSA